MNLFAICIFSFRGFSNGLAGNESTCNAGDAGRHGFDPRVRKIPWRRARQHTLDFLPGETCGKRSLAGYNPQGHKESDTTGVTEHT